MTYNTHFTLPTDTGKLNFESFCRVALHFNEEVDDEALQKELKEAFRLYDKEGESRTGAFERARTLSRALESREYSLVSVLACVKTMKRGETQQMCSFYPRRRVL